MKKFVLLNSPIFWESTEEDEQYLSPLGLGYIATYLEKSNIDVQLIDCVKEKKSVTDIITFVDRMRPDYLGINIFTQNYKIVKCIMENIYEKCECFIGGQVVKSIYQEILQWNVINKLNIIIGEGEYIIPSLALGKCEQEPELVQENKYVYRVNNNSIYFPNDISNIFLNRKYLGNEMIVNHYGEKEIAIITSRGCAFDCAFCGGAKSLNKDVNIRIRTEESVIKEIQNIIDSYPDIQSVRILDDLFLRNSKSIDMANNIFLQFPKLSWRGMVHVLSLARDIDKIEQLQIGKCKELFIGIESGSESIRKKINKLGKTDDIIKVAHEILRCGIDLKGYFIYGFPQETKNDFQKTFELASQLQAISQNTTGTFRTSVFQFRPYHGTQLFNEILENTGIIHECEFNKSISHFSGRSQFNFDFGNYSEEPDEVLNEYIIKTQELTEEKS
ncbi:MAG: B12-binding domain-containing radical SAM protein [Clostridium sp.]|nr:B12-binding domain-containing radical SAM protein [Clostridium sp.]